MPMNLEGKSAIVTGGGRGIGREVALYLAAEGANVIVVDPGGARDGSGADTTPADDVAKEIEKLGREAVPCYESVSDFAAAQGIVNLCREKFGKVDILYNGAGVLRELVKEDQKEPWKLDDLIKLIPPTLLAGYTNPAPKGT